MDEFLPQPGEVFEMIGWPRSIGFAGLRVQENEIDIGGKIQLSATEFPHPDDHQRHPAPVGVYGMAKPGRQKGFRVFKCRRDGLVGECGERLQCRLGGGATADVAHRDSCQFASAHTPKFTQDGRFVGA